MERVRAQDVRGAGWRGHAVWGTRLRPCKQIVSAGRGRMRPLPAGAVKRTASGIASEVKSEGPGPDVTGLDTLNRSLAMELRPLGLPPWCVDQATPIATPGQTVSPRGACRRASACESRHWNYPRRDDMRPVSRLGGGMKRIPQDNSVRANAICCLKSAPSFRTRAARAGTQGLRAR